MNNKLNKIINLKEKIQGRKKNKKFFNLLIKLHILIIIKINIITYIKLNTIKIRRKKDRKLKTKVINKIWIIILHHYKIS